MRDPGRNPLGHSLRGALLALAAALGLADAAAFEPIRPIPQSMAVDLPMARLGRRLFFDPRLSSDATVSCASCHDPAFGWADPRPVSVGVQGRVGTVNAPTVLNAYFNFRQFWNGRADDLVEQAAGPIHNPLEMNLSPTEAVARLRRNASYRAEFRAVFHRDDWDFSHVTRAIAEFEKALVTPNSPLDRHLRGEQPLPPKALEGYRLFKRLGCVTCHNGINVGGNSYQYLGALIPTELDAGGGDRFALTGDDFDRNRFKVPTLRNIALTAPYLHDGSQPDLEKLIELMAYHNLGFRLKRAEARLILAFLHSLTGELPEIARNP